MKKPRNMELSVFIYLIFSIPCSRNKEQQMKARTVTSIVKWKIVDCFIESDGTECLTDLQSLLSATGSKVSVLRLCLQFCATAALSALRPHSLPSREQTLSKSKTEIVDPFPSNCHLMTPFANVASVIRWLQFLDRSSMVWIFLGCYWKNTSILKRSSTVRGMALFPSKLE